MLRDTQVWPRAAAIFVPDVALADITGDDQHFLSGMKRSSLPGAHRITPSLLLTGRQRRLYCQASLDYLLQTVRGLVLSA